MRFLVTYILVSKKVKTEQEGKPRSLVIAEAAQCLQSIRCQDADAFEPLFDLICLHDLTPQELRTDLPELRLLSLGQQLNDMRAAEPGDRLPEDTALGFQNAERQSQRREALLEELAARPAWSEDGEFT